MLYINITISIVFFFFNLNFYFSVLYYVTLYMHRGSGREDVYRCTIRITVKIDKISFNPPLRLWQARTEIALLIYLNGLIFTKAPAIGM